MQELERIVQLAHRHVVLLVPFGGGSNIVGAVEPTPGQRNDLMIVTIDMKRMNRVRFKRSCDISSFFLSFFSSNFELLFFLSFAGFID